MSEPFVDANIFVRLLSGDDLSKQKRAVQLFEQVKQGKITLRTHLNTIADVVFVLSSRYLYRLPRQQVASLVLPLVRLPHLKMRERTIVIEALQLYAASPLDFSDAVLVAAMKHAKTTTIYSYDKHFDTLTGIVRTEP